MEMSLKNEVYISQKILKGAPDFFKEAFKNYWSNIK